MANATITVDSALKERLADLASQTGQPQRHVRRIAAATVAEAALTLTVEDVNRLANATHVGW
jgi:predicted transcriptional regulator